MILDSVAAWTLEDGDIVSLGSPDHLFKVSVLFTVPDSVDVMLTDEDGETALFSFAPADTLEVVTSWD